MKKFKKIISIFLLVNILFVNITFAQPIRMYDEKTNIDWGEIVKDMGERIAVDSAKIIGICGAVGVGQALIDAAVNYLKSELGKALYKVKGFFSNLARMTVGRTIMQGAASLLKLVPFVGDALSDFFSKTSIPQYVEVVNFDEKIFAEKIEKAFTECVNKTLAFYFASLINEIGFSLLNWINAGFKGDPLFVYSYRALTQSAFNQAFGEFIYEYNPYGLGKLLCSGAQIDDFKFLLNLYTIQPPPSIGSFRCRLTDIYNNVESFNRELAQQFDNPWKHLEVRINRLALQDPTWRYNLLLEQKERIQLRAVQEMNLLTSEGFISAQVCKKVDPATGVCIEKEISHPASLTKELMVFGFKAPIENIFQKAQNIQSLSDLKALLSMWFIVLSNNALSVYIKEGLKRSLRGAAFTEASQAYIAQAASEAKKNLADSLASLSKGLIEGVINTYGDYQNVNSLITNVNSTLQSKFNLSLSVDLSQIDNVFYMAKMCLIGGYANNLINGSNIYFDINKDSQRIDEVAEYTVKLFDKASTTYREIYNINMDSEKSIDELLSSISKLNDIVNDLINTNRNIVSSLSCENQSSYMNLKDGLRWDDALVVRLSNEIQNLENTVNSQCGSDSQYQNARDKWNKVIDFVISSKSILSDIKTKLENNTNFKDEYKNKFLTYAYDRLLAYISKASSTLSQGCKDPY